MVGQTGHSPEHGTLGYLIKLYCPHISVPEGCKHMQMATSLSLASLANLRARKETLLVLFFQDCTVGSW